MKICDKCGGSVKAFWRAYSTKTFKHIDLCNHHYEEYKQNLKLQAFVTTAVEDINILTAKEPV